MTYTDSFGTIERYESLLREASQERRNRRNIRSLRG